MPIPEPVEFVAELDQAGELSYGRPGLLLKWVHDGEDGQTVHVCQIGLPSEIVVTLAGHIYGYVKVTLEVIPREEE